MRYKGEPNNYHNFKVIANVRVILKYLKQLKQKMKMPIAEKFTGPVNTT